MPWYSLLFHHSSFHLYVGIAHASVRDFSLSDVIGSEFSELQ